MAAAAQSNIVLSPFDNPFALLGTRRTSVEAALNMENKDFEKAYHMASKILHPDKVKDQNDKKLKATMSEQFCKAALAKELLVVPPGNHAAMTRRNTYIRRYLWTEQELAHESSAWGAVDDSMRGEETTHGHLKENLGGAIRALPGIGLLQGHQLQAFSRRGLSKTKKNAH